MNYLQMLLCVSDKKCSEFDFKVEGVFLQMFVEFNRVKLIVFFSGCRANHPLGNHSPGHSATEGAQFSVFRKVSVMQLCSRQQHIIIIINLVFQAKVPIPLLRRERKREAPLRIRRIGVVPVPELHAFGRDPLTAFPRPNLCCT